MLSFFALTICARAATLTVTSAADSGPGSLRQATFDAFPGDSIVIAPSVTTISLFSELAIENRLNITGGGIARAVIYGSNFTRLFNVFPTGNLTLSHLSLVAGKATDADGGAILSAGNVVIDDVIFESNAVASTTTDVHGGGAIANGGTMSIERSWFLQNVVGIGPGLRVGGAVWNYGTMTIGDSSFWLNSVCCTGASGGAIAGGVSRSGSTTAIERSTIVDNEVTYQAPMSGAGVSAFLGTVTLHNSVVVNNTAFESGFQPYDNVSGVVSIGHNVVGTSRTPLTPASGDQVNLADSSAPSWFHAGLLTNTPDAGGFFTPALNGPLVNAGDGTGAPATDQAGNRRINGCAMDIGAVELQPLGTTMTLTVPTAVERRARFNVTADLASNARCDVTGDVEFFIDGDSVATVTLTDNRAIATLSIIVTGSHSIRAVLHTTIDYAPAEKTADVNVVSSIPTLSPPILILLGLMLAAVSVFATRRG